MIECFAGVPEAQRGTSTWSVAETLKVGQRADGTNSAQQHRSCLAEPPMKGRGRQRQESNVWTCEVTKNLACDDWLANQSLGKDVGHTVKCNALSAKLPGSSLPDTLM